MKNKLKILLLSIAILFSACGDNTTISPIKDIKSISINGTTKNIYATDKLELNATVTYDDGTIEDITKNIIWKSLDSDILYSNAGNIEARSNSGDTNISIEYSKFSDTKNINIIKLTSINFSELNSSQHSQEQTLYVSGNFENNESNRTMQSNITWISDENITISESNQTAIKLTITNSPATITGILFRYSENEVEFSKTF